MPVMVRVVLPLAAGAMLAPLPSWASSATAGVREAIPIRVVLEQAAVREEGLIEGEIGHAGTDSDLRVSKAFKAGSRLSTLAGAPVALPSAGSRTEIRHLIFVQPPRGPDRRASGWSPSHAPRAPPV